MVCWKKEIVKYSPMIVNDEVSVALERSKKIEEQFKGEVEQKEVKFPIELGEEHPFDFSMCEELNKKEGFVNAVIDKYVDFVVGPGFYVECEDERALKIIEDFNTEVNMDTQLRAWVRQALAKGNSDLELGGGKDESIQGMKLLNSNYIYIKRNEFGEVLGFNQYKGAFKKFDKNKIIPFEPWEIVHLNLNKIGDGAYGYGIVYPALVTINNMLRSEKDLHMLMSRKANSPYHIKMGGVYGGKYYKPNPSDVSRLGKELEYQTNKHEWTTDGLTEIKVLDFGNIGEKFDIVLKYDQEKLFYIFQIPAVIMGMANVPEGLAKVQMDAFERRIQSIQAEVEKLIEEQIYKRVLNSQGLDFHVEFQWGRPSNQEKAERLLRITELMKIPIISQSLFKLMEKDVVKLLDYNEDEYEQMTAEEERKREEERPQPIVPGENESPPQLPIKQPIPKESLKEFIRKVGSKWKVFSHTTGKLLGTYDSEEEAKKALQRMAMFKRMKQFYTKEICPHCQESWENINDIQEWLNFNYRDYVKSISAFIKSDDFYNLKAESDIEEAAGYLTPTQINELKRVLNKGFVEGKGIREIARNIDMKVKPNDLYEITTEDKLGNLIRSRDVRSIGIARTEISRVANEGAIKQFEEAGISKIRWVASSGDRTCPDCEALNGVIFETFNHPDIPLHPYCRCTTIAITELT